jgi:hypothetical protein
MPTWADIRESADLRAGHNLRGKRSWAIQSQYSASVRILALAKGFQEMLDPTPDMALFYKKVFNILTAEGCGLDLWGRIVGMDRTVSDESVSITLDDEMYRLLLLYKALANISAATADSLNKLLASLIATGVGALPKTAYVLEVDTMVIRWVFEDFFNEIQQAVFSVAGPLAKGAGVGWELYAIDPDKVFGFDGSSMLPFNQAPFVPDNAMISHRG